MQDNQWAGLLTKKTKPRSGALQAFITTCTIGSLQHREGYFESGQSASGVHAGASDGHRQHLWAHEQQQQRRHAKR